MRASNSAKRSARKKAAKAIKTLLRRTTPKVKPAKLLPRANARLALSNARKIKQLSRAQFGRIQHQVSRLADTTVIVRDHPICFQLNNVTTGLDGPQILRGKGSGDHCDRVTDFQLVEDRPLMNDRETAHYANGPRMFINYAHLKFHFRAHVDATRIRIDIVRQKKGTIPNIWNPHAGGTNYMPNLMHGFQRICGFSTNEIDRSMFQVLMTKHIYMNSKGTANAIDTAEDRNTTDATGPRDRYCSFRVPLNKVYTQLDSSINEANGNDEQDMNVHNEDGNESKGSYSWDNQHPLKNVWCVVSTDDVTALTAALDGDGIQVDCIRKMSWRDLAS